METSRSPRTAAWVVGAACVGALLAYGVMRAFPDLSLFDVGSQDRDAEIVSSITREEQVVLLSLGIQGIAEQSETGSFLGMDVPGTGRSSFVQYGFNAKLGIEGSDVRIDRAGEDELVISVPEFIFIGHDDESFRTVVEDNGVLSWVTPQIDTVEMINNVLDEGGQDQYIDENREILEDQARAFYTAIVTSIDPTVALRFEFR
ncbi:hypothetical protein [Cellulomonas dongxiuzhuiae]|uniref:DUF4230 domain-containing protein n=1 Tax=Cellulomonas dongxiuzhuiae TaxID=2819979 RepID=A0ABX8GJP6_9CELL|nr:hypothetical protein [Cellulomonas dongxiuzhuiae]MBO3095307.1 hypothetical protein [Cellulomonas dongxiuzhuiae]QWC16299.1 hypothetical protein KKR89_01040 [Cellulomonas dongxiuzhuiae]